MSDKRDDERDATLPLVVTRTGGGGGRGHGRLLDPRQSMPGAVKDTAARAAMAEPMAGDKAEMRRRYFEFVHHLAHPAKVEDLNSVPAALAATFGIPREEAERRQVELHDAMTAATRTATFGDTLRRKNADVHARTARVADFLYSPDPKIALVAAKLLNDMDEGATATTEETIEDHIRTLLEE